jgi:hypothetical protein
VWTDSFFFLCRKDCVWKLPQASESTSGAESGKSVDDVSIALVVGVRRGQDFEVWVFVERIYDCRDTVKMHRGI